MTNPTLTTAHQLLAAGYSILPIEPDGTKAPARHLGRWKPYTQAPPTPAQADEWWADGTPYGLAIISGTVSGNLELLEVEGRAAHHLPHLRTIAHDTGLGDLWDTITQGWVERSPSGGFHFRYRLTNHPVPGNTKIARRPATPDELEVNPRDKVKVLVETRGEGGYAIASPTGGNCHPTGHGWSRLLGNPTTCPTITWEQREALVAIFATLDQPLVTGPAAAPQTLEAATVRPTTRTAGTTPGDDFEARTDWADILTPHGWTLTHTRADGSREWTRPGKNPGDGISATTGRANDRDRLYVFTSSTEFTPETPYTKFGAYALLQHGGDHTAAARALAGQGYGEERRGPDPLIDGLTTRPFQAGGTDIPGVPDLDTLLAAADRPTTYTETDDGNALRLVDMHHDSIRFVPQRGQWLVWDGHRWRWDEAGRVQELARNAARTLPDPKHRHRSLSRRSVEAMCALARTDTRIAVNLADLDANPHQLNTPGGVVDLTTGTLTTPDPKALNTRSTTVTPDFDTPPTRWLNFLADTFAGDPDVTTYVQRLLGVSLVGQVLEQLLPFAYGSGANGKTTLAGVVQRIVGIGDDGYSISAPAEMLLATNTQSHPTEIARLAGARLVITSELEDGQRFAEARIKQLTGRDTISGRFMRQDWFSFTPTHTLWLLANYQPAVKAGGPAFWRRLRLIPFVHTVPPEKRIPDLENQLVELEGPQILGWIIQGARDYFTHGINEPETVKTATESYQKDTDTVARFVEDKCELGSPTAQHMHIKVATLRQAYEAWCRLEGEESVSAKALTSALTSRFHVVAGRDRAARWYSGIRLAEETDEPVTGSDVPTLWNGGDVPL